MIDIKKLVGGHIETWFGDFNKLTLVIIHSQLSNELKRKDSKFLLEFTGVQKFECKNKDADSYNHIQQISKLINLFSEEMEILEISLDDNNIYFECENYDFFGFSQMITLHMVCDKVELK